MSQQNADSVAADCRRRAERMLHLASFIEARCERFLCLCAHDDGHLHVYDEEPAKAEFGADGWEFIRPSGDGKDYYGKTVEGVPVSFWIPSAPHHAFVPMLP